MAVTELGAIKREFVMVMIPAGQFIMGSKAGHGEEDEFPAHNVHVDEFLIGRYPITASEWARFLNSAHAPEHEYFEPSKQTTVIEVDGRYYPRKGCSRHPANGVTWFGAEAYCQWLSARTGRDFRLPSEAEWEKAARGGLEGERYPWGSSSPQGWAQFHQVWADPKHTLSPVGAYPPNKYGLYDMVGNVWEWCADWYERYYYQVSPQDNPAGPETGERKVMRGGSWGGLDVHVRCAIRLGEFRDISDSGVGFRVARLP